MFSATSPASRPRYFYWANLTFDAPLKDEYVYHLTGLDLLFAPGSFFHTKWDDGARAADGVNPLQLNFYCVLAIHRQ